MYSKNDLYNCDQKNSIITLTMGVRRNTKTVQDRMNRHSLMLEFAAVQRTERHVQHSEIAPLML